MQQTFEILDLKAVLPSCGTPEELLEWARGRREPERDGKFPRPQKLPIMTARRLDTGCKLAVELGLELFQRHPGIQAVVYSSRHGELKRNYRVLQALAAGSEVSPTDFTMSVHNAAAGTFTITAGAALPASALSAGPDSFCQAFFEVYSFFARGLDRVLLVYFDTTLPEVYLPVLPEDCASCSWARALALVLAPGGGLSLELKPAGSGRAGSAAAPELPQDLMFLKNFLLKLPAFELAGARGQKWVFRRQLPEQGIQAEAVPDGVVPGRAESDRVVPVPAQAGPDKMEADKTGTGNAVPGRPGSGGGE